MANILIVGNETYSGVLCSMLDAEGISFTRQHSEEGAISSLQLHNYAFDLILMRMSFSIPGALDVMSHLKMYPYKSIPVLIMPTGGDDLWLQAREVMEHLKYVLPFKNRTLAAAA